MKLAALWALPVLLSAATPADTARAKLDRVYDGMTKPGEVISLSPDEVNAWIREKTPFVSPEGIRNTHIDLGTEAVTGSALVDFLKIREGHKQSTSALLAPLIEGERPLKITVRLVSSGGRCTVYLTRVELGGAVLEGSTLDFLIKTVFTPLYPDAKIDQPFELDFNIDRIDISPSGVRIAIKK